MRAETMRTMRTIAGCTDDAIDRTVCTDNAHDALVMHVARAIRACLAHRWHRARPHRQLKALLARC